VSVSFHYLFALHPLTGIQGSPFSTWVRSAVYVGTLITSGSPRPTHHRCHGKIDFAGRRDVVLILDPPVRVDQ
jgi:hypothetical protein